MSLEQPQNYATFIILTYTTSNAESMVNIGPILLSFCPVVAKIPQTPFLNSEVTEHVFTMFSHDVEGFILSLMHAL